MCIDLCAIGTVKIPCFQDLQNGARAYCDQIVWIGSQEFEYRLVNSTNVVLFFEITEKVGTKEETVRKKERKKERNAFYNIKFSCTYIF